MSIRALVFAIGLIGVLSAHLHAAPQEPLVRVADAEQAKGALRVAHHGLRPVRQQRGVIHRSTVRRHLVGARTAGARAVAAAHASLVQPAHLVLATRMPPGVDHAWAWADWLEVRLRVGAVPTVWEEQTGKQKAKLVA